MAQNSMILTPFSLVFLCSLLTACAPKKELSSDLLSSLGDKAVSQNDPKAAQDMYNRALKSQPNNQLALTKLLRLHLDQKNYRDIILLTNNLPIDNLDALRHRAIAFDLTGQHAKAQEVYVKLLQHFPTDDRAHLNLILSYRLSENPAAALMHIKACHEKISDEYHPKLDALEEICKGSATNYTQSSSRDG